MQRNRKWDEDRYILGEERLDLTHTRTWKRINSKRRGGEKKRFIEIEPRFKRKYIRRTVGSRSDCFLLSYLTGDKTCLDIQDTQYKNNARSTNITNSEEKNHGKCLFTNQEMRMEIWIINRLNSGGRRKSKTLAAIKANKTPSKSITSLCRYLMEDDIYIFRLIKNDKESGGW